MGRKRELVPGTKAWAEAHIADAIERARVRAKPPKQPPKLRLRPKARKKWEDA